LSVTSKELALSAVQAAIDKKGVQPTLLDLTGEGAYTDFILVVSGRSDRHVQSVAEGIERTLKEELGRRPLGVEGNRDGQWSLIDYGDIVVHVFYHPIRDFYDLEGLWGTAPRVPIEIPPDSQLQYSDAYGL
jgi:ribosome-associated protein